jgi:hypothetical protein
MLSFHISSVIIYHWLSSSGMKIKSSGSLHGDVKRYNFACHALRYIGIDKHASKWLLYDYNSAYCCRSSVFLFMQRNYFVFEPMRVTTKLFFEFLVLK